MENIKEELLDTLESWTPKPEIKCAYIDLVKSLYSKDLDSNKEVRLKVDYSEKEYESFLNDLDLEFDNDNYVGRVFLQDGSWLERSEVNDEYHWQRRFAPKIPEFLLSHGDK